MMKQLLSATLIVLFAKTAAYAGTLEKQATPQPLTEIVVSADEDYDFVPIIAAAGGGIALLAFLLSNTSSSSSSGS